MSGYRKRALPFIRGVPVLVGAAALVMLLLATTSTASGAGSTKLRLATGQITPGATYYGSKTLSGSIAQTDPSLLGQTGSQKPVMIKYDFDATASYTGDLAGLAATSPRVTGKALANNASAVAAYEATRRRDAGDHRRRRGRSARRRRRTGFKTVYGGVARRVPANRWQRCSRSPASRRCSATRWSSRSTTTPRSSARRTSGRRSAGRSNAGEQRHRRRHRHRHLARASVASRTTACRAAPAAVRRASSATAPTPPTSARPFTCNDKLIGAYAFLNTYMAVSGTRPDEFCNATTRHVLARATPRATARTPRRRPPATCVDSAAALRRRARPGQRHRPRRPRDHVPRLRCDRAASAPTPSRPCSRRSPTASNVINFSICGARNPYTDPVELAFLDAYERRHLRQRLGRQQRPRRRRPPSTAARGSTTVGASTGPALVHLDAAPDRRRRRDVRHGRRHAHERRSARRRRSCSPRASRARTRSARRRCSAGAATGKVVALPARRQRPRRQGLQRPRRAARPG